MKLLLFAPFIIGFLFFVALFVFIAYRRAWRIPQPNEALIIVGKKKGAGGSVVAQDKVGEAAANIENDRLEGLEFRIATSATWVNPVTSKVSKLSLKSLSTTFSAEAHDRDKIAVTVRGVLLYKVGDNYDSMARAARRFLDVDEREMNNYIENLVTGQVRALVGGVSIEELITDRQALMENVRKATYEDMAKIGLQIDSLTIQEITDPNDYIKDLGRPQAEAVARQASIAADEARQAREEAKEAADREIAKTRRDTQVINAQYKAEQDEAQEKAAQAGPLARAQAEKDVVDKETAVAELAVKKAEKMYDAEVRERAKADRFRIEEEAQANKARRVAEAEAQAASTEKLGDAEAAATKARGQAEAEAIEARGKAEASATREKAEALAENGQLVLQQQITEQMPDIAKAVAEPIGSVDNMVILDGSEGLTKTVTGGIAAAGAAVEEILSLSHSGGGKQNSTPAPDDDNSDNTSSSPQPLSSPDFKGEEDDSTTVNRTPSLEELRQRSEKAQAEEAAGKNEEENIADNQPGNDDSARDIEADLSTVYQRLLSFSALDVNEYFTMINDDAQLMGALNNVLKNEDAYQQIIDRLPTGLSGKMLNQFLAEYRNNLL